jgi:hypothetical protein
VVSPPRVGAQQVQSHSEAVVPNRVECIVDVSLQCSLGPQKTARTLLIS